MKPLIELKTLVSSLLMFVFFLALSGCGKVQLKPLENHATILAFGDSLTAGKGVSEQHSYPTVLAQLTGLRVINAGVSGEVTKDGLARLPQILEQQNVDLMVLIEGGNDILRNMDLVQTEQNLDQMIQLAKGRGIEVILLGVPKKSLFSDSADFYQQLADKHQLIFDGELSASMLRSPALKSDSVHFNEQGYNKLATHIYQLLDDHGAL